MLNTDTIVALATPQGRAGVAVIRVSGKDIQSIVNGVVKTTLKPRFATLVNFFDKEEVVDQGIAIYFSGPNSFTGEDVLEIHCHGSIVVIDILLKRIIELGARIAEPGEFSKRAFLNDKIDLIQAEAIADLIDSNTELAAQASIKSLQGEFSGKVTQILSELTELRVYIEASIDFPDEELDLLEDGKILQRCLIVSIELQKLINKSKLGNKLRQGIKIVLAGPPNAGKSTLLNKLAAREVSIVTDIAGTTRDVMRDQMDVNGILFNLSDTAGIRETQDQIEAEGIKRSKQELENADHLLWVVDREDDIKIDLEKLLKSLQKNDIDITVIVNKSDLHNIAPIKTRKNKLNVIYLSAKMEEGLDILKHHLNDCYKDHNSEEDIFIARERHIESLKKAHLSLQQGISQLEKKQPLDLIAEDLKYTHNHVGELTGKISSDELLGKIFSSFCIGK